MQAMNNKVTLRLETALMKMLIKDAEHSDVPVSWIVRRILREHYANFPVGAFVKVAHDE